MSSSEDETLPEINVTDGRESEIELGMKNSKSRALSQEEVVEDESSGSEGGSEEEEIIGGESSEDDAELYESSEDEKSDIEDIISVRESNPPKSLSEREHFNFAKSLHVDDVSSDEEDQRNTIGNVPLHWYDHLPHIGYDKSGKKIMRPAGRTGLDAALAARDDPNFKWAVRDDYNGEEHVLTQRELMLLHRLQQGNVAAHPEHNPTPDYCDYFSSKKIIYSLNSNPAPKRNFIPSKFEELRISRIARGIREGRIKFHRKKAEPDIFLMWNDAGETDAEKKRRRGPPKIAPPKMKLPGHAESYNPPEEYLPTEEELAEWSELDPEDRPYNFVPQKFKSLRHVPGYANFVRERFERCLDLYLCTRVKRNKMNVDPRSLLPKLPDPSELRPYPSSECKYLSFDGHNGRVRSISVSPSGQWLLSASEDKTVRLWETDTGRCTKIWKTEEFSEGTPAHVVWNPDVHLHCAAVSVGNDVLLLDTGIFTCQSRSGDGLQEDPMSTAFSAPLTGDYTGANVVWEKIGSWADEDREDKNGENGEDAVMIPEKKSGFRMRLRHKFQVKSVTWHIRGDYFASVCPAPSAASRAVNVHQLSRRSSQQPFKNIKGIVQKVVFHPSKPVFFVSTKKNIRVYHLIRQELIKKLVSGAKWISSLAVHPTGDHIIVGSFDCKLCWFDLDLASKPFRTLSYHKKAVRQSTFHSRYPLMATASDDGTVHIFHAKVYSDLMKNPLIVPVKILRGHKVVNNFGVLDCQFHPTQPWIFTSGADKSIRLYQNLP